MLDKKTQHPEEAFDRDYLPPAFSCSWTTEGEDLAWVTVAGELDVATAPALAQTLNEAQHPARLVVLDLREVAFLDSSSVHAIVDESKSARLAGHRLVVLRAPTTIDRIFGLTGACDDLEMVDQHPTATSDLSFPLAQ